MSQAHTPAAMALISKANCRTPSSLSRRWISWVWSIAAAGWPDEVRRLMGERGERIAAVNDGDAFLGLVSAEDIAEALVVSSFVQLQPTSEIPPYESSARGSMGVIGLVAVAGGDSAREVQSAVFNDADIVVVWKGFSEPGPESRQLAETFLSQVH